MPVFDFNSTPDEKKPAECTYTVIRSNENEATAEKPIFFWTMLPASGLIIPAVYLRTRLREPLSNSSRKTEP